MEFPININNLFTDDISLIDSRLQPCGNGNRYDREQQQQLCSVLDKMGDASAKAQGLHGAITGGHKLAISDHHLFVMKEDDANGGKGALVGILKTGHKKLFIYDRDGGHHEMEPLCVLDFYVHESRQRKGYGKTLFEHMLREENVKPQHLAIDRPSPKFLAFLKKHYHLKASIPQVNKFVIFESFFRDRPAERRLVNGRMPSHPYNYRRQGSGMSGDTGTSRYTSAGSRVSPSRQNTYSQLQREKEALSGIRPNSRENVNGLDRPSSGCNNSRNGSRTQDPGVPSRNMGAHHNMYSRHLTNPTPPPPDEGKDQISPPEVDALKRVGKDMREVPAPILLRRDGPSKEYMQLMHGNCDYQDRRGHLKVGPLETQPVAMETAATTTAATKTSPKHFRNGFGGGRSCLSMNKQRNINAQLPPADPYTSHSAKPRELNTGWNIFGVQQREVSAGSRKFQHTRPW